MRWYYDFISPYAYLQSTRLDRFANSESVECVPVLFAALLKAWGNLGPAEIAPKRLWTFKNVTWLAHRDSIALKLPVHHPFNPLPLLRLSILLNNEVAVVQRLFRFVWVEGHVPQQAAEFQSLLDELGVTASQLEAAEIKRQLMTNGEQAIARGVFGVPTIERDDELFWGYEATDMALAHTDTSLWPADALRAAAALPQGTQRKR